jgi:fucose permease
MKLSSEQETLLEAESPNPARSIWVGISLTLAFATFILIGTNSGAFGVLLPDLSAYYNLEKASTGYLFVAGTFGYVIAALASGYLVERLGLRQFLMGGIVVFGLGSLVMGTAPWLGLVLVARLIIGLGAAVMETGANLMVTVLPRNTTLLNYLHAFFGAGALLGPIVASLSLSAGWGWNGLFLVWVAISLLLLASFAFLFRPPVPADKPAEAIAGGHPPAEKNSSGGNLMLASLKQKSVWLTSLFLLVYVGVEMSLGIWSYTFLTEGKNYPKELSSWAVSGYWAGLTAGRLILAKLAEGRGVGDRGLLGGCLVGTVGGIGLIWLGPNEISAIVGLVLVGFSLGPIYPTSMAVLSKQVDKKLVPSAIGFTASLSIVGVTMFPWLAGVLAQGFGLGTLPVYGLVLTALMVGFWRLLFQKPAGFSG